MPGFIEVVPISDVFSDNIGSVEIVGGSLVRVYFCAREAGENRLVARVLRPIIDFEGRVSQMIAQARLGLAGMHLH